MRRYAVSISTHPDKQMGRAAELLAAIAHERRLAIVRILLERELCVCELQATFDWPQPLISHHLGVLRKSGLVRDRRDAQWVYYSLVPERLAELREALGFLLGASGTAPAARYGANQRCCS
ncbi:MAG: metalloregulator ArsR/SmtB family transcription factor [Chloroflexi bacterium]|nr:metalloregulator ArsR/SmtB family transcription factor [Chloroflexota bacterium]